MHKRTSLRRRDLILHIYALLFGTVISHVTSHVVVHSPEQSYVVNVAYITQPGVLRRHTYMPEEGRRH